MLRYFLALHMMGTMATAIAVSAVTERDVTRGDALSPALSHPKEQIDEKLLLMKAHIERTSPTAHGSDEESRALWATLQQFYAGREYQLAWITGTSAGPLIDALIGALTAADRHGLDPQLYAARDLAATYHARFDAQQAVALDVWLTHLFLQYAADLADGVTTLGYVDPQWRIRPQRSDLLPVLHDAVDGKRVRESLEAVAPAHPEYVALRGALERYRRLAIDGAWVSLPETLALRPGQSNEHVPALARRLTVEGDLEPNDQPAPARGAASPATGESETVAPSVAVYDTVLHTAVRRFQHRHGLAEDGVIGKAVVARLNVPIAQRIRQIELNLERWRWMPRDLGRDHLVVNIPEYRLTAWEEGRAALTMRVVVGKKTNQTPIFSDEMTHVVFSPYWNVPPDILRNETLPAVTRDPGYIARNNYEVLGPLGKIVDPWTADWTSGGYRIRQRPGAGNSLGLVKFLFPNQFNVYLHDTPADSLFARPARAYSHGCIRVAEPQKLAEYVLREQPDWTEDRIVAAMNAGREKHVKLLNPIPVYIGYWTARAEADGTVHFREDVYGLDARQGRALDARLETLRDQARLRTPESLTRPSDSRVAESVVGILRR